MLDPCKGAVVDLPEVFVSAYWALRTTKENVVHALTLLATGTFWSVCKSPQVHIFVCVPHFGSCSVERDLVLPAKRCSSYLLILVGWQGIIWWADAILDPFLQSGGRRLLRVERFHRRKTAPGSETRCYLLVIVEWVARVNKLFIPLKSGYGISACAGRRAMPESLGSVGSGVGP